MRRFISSIFLFLCAVIALADVSGIDNVIYLSPSAAKPNSEATLSFKMKNTVGIRGFQLDQAHWGTLPMMLSGWHICGLTIEQTAPRDLCLKPSRYNV